MSANEKMITTTVPADMQRALKSLAVQEDTTLKALFTEAINKLLASRGLPTFALAFMILISGCDNGEQLRKAEPVETLDMAYSIS